MHQFLASLLSDDAVVSRQMHIAVDFNNALELENRLYDGRGDETNALAKGTGALWGHNLQAPILNEALADDNVHVVFWLSGLTQLLDENVKEEEKDLTFLQLRFSTVRISRKCSWLVAK